MNLLLPALILFPLAAGALLALLRPADYRVARAAGLAASAVTLLLALATAAQYAALPPATGDGPVSPRVALRSAWMTFPQPGGDLRLEFFVGLDGISLALVLLTTLLTAAAVLASWESLRSRAAAFYGMLLLLEGGLLGAFCALDLLLFYVCFEFTLVPLFFLIGIWGGPDRRRAARRFVIYTLCGSLATLVGLVAVGVAGARGYRLATPFSIPDLAAAFAADPLPYGLQVGLLAAISLGFAVKIPLVPFHTWQPLAYVEAPTAGTALLSGVVLKMGAYGFVRVCLPLLPDATPAVGVPVVATLATVGILYGGLCALAQRDMKRLIAYSSLSHLGFVMLGLFALNVEGMTGGVLQMINHGLSTGALFLLVGMISDRYHTRQLTRLGGLAARLPLLTACTVFVCLASLGLPGLNGFVGEYLSLSGMFAARPVFAAVGAAGVVLGAWYLLSMLQRGFFGPLREPGGPANESVRDLRPREAVILAPLMALCLWIGVYPQPLLNLIEPDVRRVARLYDGDARSTRGLASTNEAHPSHRVGRVSERSQGSL